MITANDYCHSVFDGTHATPKPCPNGYKLVTSKNITNDGINTSDAYFISEQDYFEINKRSKVYQWDILFSMIGTVGNLYLEEKSDIDYAIKNIGVFSCRDEFKAKWLFYYLQSPMARNHIKRFLNGAVQKFLSLKQLRDFPILPFEKDKISIVEILSALDKKIALNKQINARLEEMAKTLYDYWFVQFDFPDTNGKPYKSSGGEMVFDEILKREIPKGWEVKSLGDLAEIVGGSTPSTADSDNFCSNGTAWITPYDLSKNQDNKFISHGEIDVSEKGIKNASLKKYPTGTVLMSSRAPIGYMAIARNEVTTNQGFKSFIPNKGFSKEFVFYAVKNSLKSIMQSASGSTFKEVSATTLHSIQAVFPKHELVEKYTERSKKIFKIQDNLEKQNHQLTQLRDFLLPMLMNGQVSVAE